MLSPLVDWNDEATWGPALRNVAVAIGARRLVLLSGRGEQGALRGEQAERASGADWTIVRSAFMAQNFNESYLWNRCAPARSPSRPTS